MMTFCSAPDNDLYTLLTRTDRFPRYDTPEDAIRHAPRNSAVLILADGYPEAQTHVDAALFEEARARSLRLFLEYPTAVPGFTLEKPRTGDWERVVVGSPSFGEALPKGRILSISDAHYTPVTPVSAADPLLVTARVAGYDTAIFGIPKDAAPVLFEAPDARLLVATTKLSDFVTGRYGPAADWKAVWTFILGWLSPGAEPPRLEWTPLVRPAYDSGSKLPADAERRALAGGARWVMRSRLLPAPERAQEVARLLRAGEEAAPLPPPGAPSGDGSLGVQEGYSSAIRYDGSQRQRLPIRADCQAETAMVLAMDAEVNRSGKSRKVARNLLDYLFTTSGLCGGARGNPEHPAFGHIAWGAIAPAWEVANYGDDNARTLLATMLASACLGSDAWDTPMLRALFANLRTTGKLGFRGDRIDMPDLERRGWRAYADAETVNAAPHFEAYLWACELWAYRHTGHAPFLSTAKAGIRRTMEVYPGGWRLRDNSERSQMLLPLAWLVRLEDTEEHRAWLQRVAGDLMASQVPCGAIPERLDGTGGGGYNIPGSNAAYGTGETPLIQGNTDPASDQLYTTGFALLGLHEAAAATGDPALRAAEDRLAAYLCRIQVRSERFDFLDGAWFRAFDYQRWDYWSSSADAGWGAWCVESGWGQAWIASVLGLRLEKTSLWDRTAATRIRDRLESVQAEMARNDGSPWRAADRLE